MKNEISKRQLILDAIKRKGNGYVPLHLQLCPSLAKLCKENTGIDDYEDFFNIDYKIMYAQPKKTNIDFSKYYKNPKPNTTYNEFGVGYESSGFEHFTHLVSPLEFSYDIEDFKKYPYPDPDNSFDWISYEKKCIELKQNDKVVVANMAMTLFEIAWYMMGMERFLMDLLTEEDILFYHLDRLTEIRCKMAINYAKCGVDVLHIGDDVATQQSMMISADTYKKHIKPRHKAIIDAAKSINPNILVDYHSDGNCFDIIDDLIEIGVDILNPVQPECMDVVQIKKKYENSLSFRGMLGSQTVLPFGSPQDVINETNRLIKKCAYNDGLILAPSHMLEPEVKWENIMALKATVDEHNSIILKNNKSC